MTQHGDDDDNDFLEVARLDAARREARTELSDLGKLVQSIVAGGTFTNDARPALPQRTTPSERTVIGAVDASGSTMNIAAASKRYGVSVTTLKRRIRDGEIAGAHKRPAPHGDEWHLPVAALDAMYARTEPEPPPAEPPAPPSPELSVLITALDRMSSRLESEQRALQAAEADRLDARAEAARLAERVEARDRELAMVSEERDRLRVELEEERATPAPKQRWWSRR